MPLTASAEAGGFHLLNSHAQRGQLVKQLPHITSGSSCLTCRRLPGAPCGSRSSSHTLLLWPSIRAGYSSGQSESEGTSSLNQAFRATSQASSAQHSNNASDQGSEQQQPDNPSGIVSLMQAWGQLSTRLQQPAAPPAEPSSPGAAAGPTAARPSHTSSSSEDDVTQLILSALKLAVRSLSRVPAAADGSSPASSGRTTSNRPAVQRSLALAAALAELYANGVPLDAASIAAGIVAEAVDVAALHIRSVQAKLGPEVAGLVHDVLAVRHATDMVQLYDDANSSALRGWLLSAYDVRACAIEVVWRWLALVQPPGQPHQQQLAAMEALTIYCPLGHALGLGGCSAALEDAAFKVLFPSSYASTARHVLPMSGAAAELLTRCQASLQAAAAADASFQALAGGLQLLSRTKSLYSIMRKLLRLNDQAAGSRRLGEMFDLLGMRAVVLPRKDLPEDEAEAAAVQACYRLQELAHAQWPAVPGRSKDYISKPKPNGYQSLHSTLGMQALQQLMADSSSSSSGGGSGSSVVLSYLELQVRTAAMHAAAEGGDAAHAGYKGRLERRQVRQLQTWTAQLQRGLAGAKQQLLLPLPVTSSSSSSSSLQPAYSVLTTSSDDSDMEDSSSSSSSSSRLSFADSAGAAAAAAAEIAQHQEQQQQQQDDAMLDHQPAASAAAAASLFHHLDLDGDGMLSLYELTELLSELGEARPAAAAATGSGRFQQLQQHAAAGTPAAAVAPALPYAQHVFESLDTNGDGLISMAEFLEYYMSNTTQDSSQSAAAAAAAPQAAAGSGGSSRTWSAGGTNSSSSSSHMSLDRLSSSGSSSSGSSSNSGAVCQVFMHTSSTSSSSSNAPAAPTLALGSSRSSAFGASAFSGSSSSRAQQHLRPPGVATCGSWRSSSSSSSSSATGSHLRSRVRCMASAPASSGSIAAPGSQASSGSAEGLALPANGSSSSSIEGSSSVNGSGSSSINGRAAAVAVVAADVGSQAASGSQQQQQQKQPLFRPLRRPTESESAAEHGSSPAAGEQQQQQQPAEQLQQEQFAAQQPSLAAEPSSYDEDAAGSSSSSRLDGPYQQQLEAELSYEEDEQQQQRFLRQQQRQLPSLLEDAAAGRTPRYVLVPIGSSSNGASYTSYAAAAPLLSDRLGQQLQQLEVPCLGPLLLTNAPQVFRSADVLVDAPGEHYERLALSLELVKQTGSSEAILQARNLSRVVRGHQESAVVRVNYGQAMLEPHRAAVELVDGDVLELGDTGVAFVVQRQQQPAASPAAQAVQQFCGVYAQQQLGLQLNVQESLQVLQQQQQLPTAEALPQQQQQPGWNAAAADAIESELRNISRLVRSNPRAAELELCQLAAAHPEAPGPWFLWAQLAASSRRHWMARALFRAAAVCQQQQLEQVLRAGPTAAADVAAALQLPQDGAEADADPAAAEDAAAAAASSSILQQTPAVLSSGGGSKAMRRKADLRISAASRAPAFRLSSRLVQVLRVWARSEWEQRLFGPARRLWRLAANEAFKFPYDIAAEGGGAVLHAWASAEFERDNVLNARVVIGEALRKCPKDAAVAVLAASIEAAAGEVNAARALFLRAYQLNKADKQLYVQWPRMEGACGNIERARLLFGYGLSLYPSNTKILNLYACFEEQQGEVELARELHQRALGIDAASTTSMHNRVSWAGLELREGNADEARELLREGLDAHPDFPAALLLLAKLERLEGQLEAAEAYARRAQKASHAFSVAAMGELAAIYAARGDTALAANLSRHLSNVEAAQAMKQSGKLHGNQAWASYYRQSAQPQQRQVIEAAWQRKRDLGLIRQPRGAAAAAGARRQQQQQPGQGWQQQQQQQGEVFGLEFELGGVVESFDFSSAAAAAAAEPPAPEA